MFKKVLMMVLFGALALSVAGCTKSENSGPIATSGPIILFYSTECQHCQNVEKYLTDNKVTEKLTIEQKEISDKVNAQALLEKAKACNLDTNNMGVPFLWADNACLIGDEDIINFFKTKIGE
jgi:glutaredoxin